MHDGVSIGIDLGTTNSAAAIYRNGGIEMIPNALGHVLTPSAVSVDEDGAILVGLAARARQSTHPDRTVTAFKRYMGAQRTTRLGRQSFRPEDLSALVLRQLKQDAELYLGQAIDEAVITVPAYFNDKQRKATRRAGQLAGLKVERLINEPTAAALAYGLNERERETRFLVFDLGGGTFDVSILELFEGVIEVRATAGDTHLGGEDFNDIIVEMARAAIKDVAGVRTDEALYQRLRAAAERARRTLTDAPSATFSLVWKGQERRFEVTAEAFEERCEALLKRLREPVLRSLRDSGVDIDSLSEVLLIGGATRMPIVRKAATRMFGRFPASSVNPDEAVARGAAVQAALKARAADLKEIVLTDVCPFTLGVEVAERRAGGAVAAGLFAPIIDRNCVVPASREQSFFSMQDNQKSVDIKIYQGESRWVSDNVYLGEVRTPLPAGPHGAEVRCRFSYDINGLLEVDVFVPEINAHRQLVIFDEDGVSAEALEARRAELAKLKLHPRDSEAARATMARAGRCYENSLGETRDYVGRLIGQFESVLSGQDPRASEAARQDMERALDAIEGRVDL